MGNPIAQLVRGLKVLTSKGGAAEFVAASVEAGIITKTDAQRMLLDSYRKDVKSFLKQGMTPEEIKKKLDSDQPVLKLLKKIDLDVSMMHLIIQQETTQ